ncbi:MAG: hypothetical protein Q4C87_11375 [Actinomycetaceae bacterium]|nr:hypothetical protein [Actinomycetaceae bacterium]
MSDNPTPENIRPATPQENPPADFPDVPRDVTDTVDAGQEAGEDLVDRVKALFGRGSDSKDSNEDTANPTQSSESAADSQETAENVTDSGVSVLTAPKEGIAIDLPAGSGVSFSGLESLAEVSAPEASESISAEALAAPTSVPTPHPAPSSSSNTPPEQLAGRVLPAPAAPSRPINEGGAPAETPAPQEAPAAQASHEPSSQDTSEDSSFDEDLDAPTTAIPALSQRKVTSSSDSPSDSSPQKPAQQAKSHTAAAAAAGRTPRATTAHTSDEPATQSDEALVNAEPSDDPVADTPAVSQDEATTPSAPASSHDDDHFSREIWASVRNRQPVITGDDVTLPAEHSDEQAILGTSEEKAAESRPATTIPSVSDGPSEPSRAASRFGDQRTPSRGDQDEDPDPRTRIDFVGSRFPIEGAPLAPPFPSRRRRAHARNAEASALAAGGPFVPGSGRFGSHSAGPASGQAANGHTPTPTPASAAHAAHAPDHAATADAAASQPVAADQAASLRQDTVNEPSTGDHSATPSASPEPAVKQTVTPEATPSPTEETPSAADSTVETPAAPPVPAAPPSSEAVTHVADDLSTAAPADEAPTPAPLSGVGFFRATAPAPSSPSGHAQAPSSAGHTSDTDTATAADTNDHQPPASAQVEATDSDALPTAPDATTATTDASATTGATPDAAELAPTPDTTATTPGATTESPALQDDPADIATSESTPADNTPDSALSAEPATTEIAPDDLEADRILPAARDVGAVYGADQPVEDTATRRRSLMTPASSGDGPTQTLPAPSSADFPLPAPTPSPRRPLEDADSHRLSADRDSALSPLETSIFEGASVAPEMPSRTGAHWLSLILTLLLVPASWYLLTDAGTRMLIDPAGPANTGTLSLLALGELAAAIIAMGIVLFITLRSSLGAWVSGLIGTLAGLPWVAVPGIMLTTTSGIFENLANSSEVGSNIAHHIQAEGYSGRLLMLGLTLIGMAILSHSARRQGRKEEAFRAEVEKVNPLGAHYSAGARRRAAKEAQKMQAKGASPRR